MQKEAQEKAVVFIVGIVAAVAIVILLMNAQIVSFSWDDSSLMGQAVSILKGKTTCGVTQKTTCQQQQNRCTTMKGTWRGDCSKCSIKCSLPKKTKK